MDPSNYRPISLTSIICKLIEGLINLIICKLLFTSLVRPYLENAAQIWNHSLKKDIDKIERIQHKAIRFVI